jgi:hypothetical protein
MNPCFARPTVFAFVLGSLRRLPDLSGVRFSFPLKRLSHSVSTKPPSSSSCVKQAQPLQWVEILTCFREGYYVWTYDAKTSTNKKAALYFHRHKSGKTNVVIVIDEDKAYAYMNESWHESCSMDSFQFDLPFDRSKLRRPFLKTDVECYVRRMFPRVINRFLRNKKIDKDLRKKLAEDEKTLRVTTFDE